MHVVSSFKSTLPNFSCMRREQDVSSALGMFLVACLPRDIHTKGGMSLLNELCSLASSILTNSAGRTVSLQPVAEFVKDLVSVHGSMLEKRVVESIDQTGVAGVDEDEVGRLMEGLLMSLIEASRSALGTAWAGKHQGQGQQPFESKAPLELAVAPVPSSTDGLSGIFSILTACANECPLLLIHLNLPTNTSAGHSEPKLVGRAIESAVAVLAETDVEMVGSAMLFLESTVRSFYAMLFFFSLTLPSFSRYAFTCIL